MREIELKMAEVVSNQLVEVYRDLMRLPLKDSRFTFDQNTNEYVFREGIEVAVMKMEDWVINFVNTFIAVGEEMSNE